ncbi:MAG: septation protein SpoVG family protein [Ignavibacteriales bacterium]|nr:septation protein SpoVG family protein [Ignavibacteriales bacterium]
MKILRMNILKNSTGKTLAYFDTQTNDEIIIKGFRIVDGSNGLFVANPDQKGRDGKFYDTVILPREMKDELEKTAIDEYNQKKNQV